MNTAKKPTRKPTPCRTAGKRGKGRPRAGTAHDWKPAFLGALLEGLHVRDAAFIAGVHFSVMYERRKTDPEFASAWQEALASGTEALEWEAGRRAYHGRIKPVFHKGKECGGVCEYSDTLLMFLLRGRRPEIYREKFRHEHRGPDRSTFPITIVRLLATEPAIGNAG